MRKYIKFILQVPFSPHFLPKLNKNINFILGGQPEAFNNYIPADKKVDCVFFDGVEDSKQTLEQYQYFKTFFTTDSAIMFHDWNAEKTAAIKPIIVEDSHWVQILELTPPNSIGFAAFKYV